MGLTKKLKRFYNTFNKRIVAPPYFKEAQEQVDAIVLKTAEMLEVTPEWLTDKQGKDVKEFNALVNGFAKERKWDKEKTQRIQFLLNSTHHFIDYCWVRFKWEHFDDEWGKKESQFITYDPDTNDIIMQYFVPKLDNIKKRILVSKKGVIGEHNVN